MGRMDYYNGVPSKHFYYGSPKPIAMIPCHWQSKMTLMCAHLSHTLVGKKPLVLPKKLNFNHFSTTPYQVLTIILQPSFRTQYAIIKCKFVNDEKEKRKKIGSKRGKLVLPQFSSYFVRPYNKY
jgi:hypothetical protein